MIEYLIGNVDYCQNGLLICNCGNIGYSIFVNKTCSPQKGDKIKLFIYTNIKENQKRKYCFEYYGFINLFDRNWFYKLINLPSIGTKTALQILEYGHEFLEQTLSLNDEYKIASNLKVSNKIGLILKQNFSLLFLNKIGQPNNSILKALIDLGYNPSEVSTAISDLKIDIQQDFDSESAMQIINHINTKLKRLNE